MIDTVIKQMNRVFGHGFTAIIIAFLIGGMGFYYLNDHFITKDAYASDRINMVQQIRVGDRLQRLDFLNLRLDLIEQKIWELEEKVDNGGHVKWKRRLNRLIEEQERINEQIRKLNDELKRGRNDK